MFREAAEEVLRSAHGGPMTAVEITEEAIRRGLLTTQGKTPVQTMAATLYRCQRSGPIVREAVEGENRAVWGTVRWRYIGKDS